jgi:uroporphyrin-III C-methyltransferase
LLRATDKLESGVVSLVGAGPGDPGLLTIKAARRLGECDVVYHDALVSDEILTLCRPGARLVSVGKRRGSVTVPQDAILSALARDAERGLSVVRLKGGDPFVFGRGGEEALGLMERGIPFEIVPGVSSGIAAPAAAGIPVTHRGISGSVAFVTAHDAADPAVRARLAHLAQGADTLVVFMAGAELQRVGEVLIDAGLTGRTAAAVIESGTRKDQRVVRGTLASLGRMLREPAVGPVLAVIGRTVALGDLLAEGRAPRNAQARATSHV